MFDTPINKNRETGLTFSKAYDKGEFQICQHMDFIDILYKNNLGHCKNEIIQIP